MVGRNWLYIVLVLVLGGLTACQPVAAPAAALPVTGATAVAQMEVEALPEIQIEAADFSFHMPVQLQEGWVRVKLTNSGQEPHHVQFLRLNQGATFAQFQEALKQGEGPALALVQAEGGVGSVAPGMAAQAALYLPAGEYVVLCLVPSPDSVPHFARGMISSLSVTMRDFGFDLPASLPAGRLVVKVTNAGPEWHELNLLQLAPGKTMADVQAFMSHPDEAGGPPPAIPVGGINGLGVGGAGYMLLDLQPGSYVAICNIPSAANQGKPHFALGMMKEFSVVK